MDSAQSTNVESSDARLTLGAALVAASGGREMEARVSLLLPGADSGEPVRQSMLEAVERLLGEGGQVNLDLSQTDMAAWTADLVALRDKLKSGA